MATAIQKTSGSGTGDRGSVHQYSGSESRVPNPVSQSSCDSESQSCYTNVSSEPVLSSPATKVIGGVLAAGTAAAAVGVMLGLGGEPVLEGEAQIGRWIETAGINVREGNYAVAAYLFERAADALSADPSATDKLQRAITLFDSVIENRKKGIEEISLVKAPATSETILELLDRAVTANYLQQHTVHNLASQTADAEGKKAKVLRALDRVAEAAQIEHMLVGTYIGIDEREKKFLRDFPDNQLPSLNCEAKAFKTLTALAQDYFALGEFDKALAAAEDAAAMKGIRINDGDFVPIDAEPLYQQLKAEYIFAKLSPSDVVQRLDNMINLYMKAESSEGLAWAFGERAANLPPDQKYEAALSYRASGAWYRLATDPNFVTRRMGYLLRGALTFEVAFRELLQAQPQPFPESEPLTEDEKDSLAKSSAQFSKALELLEDADVRGLDNRIYILRMTLAANISETEAKMGNFESAAKAYDAMASVINGRIKAFENRGTEVDEIFLTTSALRSSLIETRQKAVEMWERAISKVRETGSMRNILRLTFGYETALVEERAAVQSSNLPEAEKDTFERSFTVRLGWMWNWRKNALQVIRAGRPSEGSAPDVQELSYEWHLRELALRVAARDASAYREFVQAAAIASGTTPDKVVAALKGEEEGAARDGIEKYVGGDPLLLTALRRAATDPNFGRGREARPRDRDRTAEVRGR